MAASRVNDIREAPIKHRDEPHLHREVCSDRMTVKQAQPDMLATRDRPQ